MTSLFLRNARVPAMFLDKRCSDLTGRVVTCEVRDGRFASVEPAPQQPAPARSAGRTIDLDGCWLLPPFCESHAHFVYGAVRERMKRDDVELSAWLAGESKGDVRSTGDVRSDWLLGVREFDDTSFEHLVTVSRPCFVWSIDHHRAFVNTTAAEHLGVESGVLVEHDAFAAWERVPVPGQDLGTEAERWLAFGVGAVTTFDRLGSLAVLRAWAQRGELPLRIAHSVPSEIFLRDQAQDLATPGEGADACPPAPIDRACYPGGRFQVRWVKMFFDGTLGSSTAYLFEPYSDRGGDVDGNGHNNKSCGLSLVDAPTRERALDRISASGYSVAIHAIGDRAVHDAATFIVELRRRRGGGGLDRIEHAELIDARTMQYLAEHQIPVSVQPCHLLEDWKLVPARWGESRAKRTFPLRSLEQLGVPMILGTDAPVETRDPWINLRVAVDRVGRDATEAWVPEQRVSLASALAAYTFGAAELNGLPTGWGMISPGSPADFQLLATHAELESIATIVDAHWAATIIDGEIAAGHWPTNSGVGQGSA